jgi:translation elongation factor EF-1beta
MGKPVKVILSPMEHTEPKKEKSPVAFGVKAVEGLFAVERAPSSTTSGLPKNGF